MRGLQVYEVEKVMNILHPSGKIALLYSNELAGFFEIIRRQLVPSLFSYISVPRSVHVYCKNPTEIISVSAKFISAVLYYLL